MRIDHEVTHCGGLILLVVIAIWTRVWPEHLMSQLVYVVDYRTAMMMVLSISVWTGGGAFIGVFSNPVPHGDIMMIPVTGALLLLLLTLMPAIGPKPFQLVNLMPMATALILMIPTHRLFWASVDKRTSNG